VQPRHLAALGFAVAAVGYAAWVPLVLLTFGPGFRLLVEAVTIAGLLAAAAGTRRGERLVVPVALGLVLVVRALAGWTDPQPPGPRVVPDAALLLGLLLLVPDLGPPWTRFGGTLAATGAFAWFPIQAIDGHLGWSVGTWVQAAGFVLVALGDRREGTAPAGPTAPEQGGGDRRKHRGRT
jgi:hypothetical protein